jgi:hypothetical protein
LNGGPHPAFSVSVASKEFSLAVSSLFAILTRRFISVAVKGLKAIVGRGSYTVWANQWKVVDGPVRQRKGPFDAHGKRARIWCHKHKGRVAWQ